MSDEPSQRPWRAKRSPIGSNTWIVSGETFVASASRPAEAALIVAAVNKHGMPIVELVKAYDVLEAERDRLRDALNEVCRRVSVALNCPMDATEEVELLVHDILGIKECASAAIVEDKE